MDMAGEYRIKKISAADQVYDQLRQLITNGTWKAGEKIPTEGQLAEEFAVNRLTVRVALQRLQAIGLLDIRVGSGTYVKEFDMCGNIQELSAFYMDATSPQDALEYRYVIEMECARLAVERRTEEDLASYWRQYEQMENHMARYFRAETPASADQELVLQADMSLEIHTILCAMAHNALLNYAFAIAKAPLRQLMLQNVVRRMVDFETSSHWMQHYARLHDCIRERDLENTLACLKKIMSSGVPSEQGAPFCE
jgi:GntR family transcriptional repressor for pyruvate dehydrogenase complex